MTVSRRAYLGHANLPKAATPYLIEDYPAAAAKTCRAFVEVCQNSGAGAEGQGLVIYSKPGTGKSCLAQAVLREVLTTAPPEWLGCGARDASRPGYYLPHLEFLELHYDLYRDNEYSERAGGLLKALKCRSLNGWDNVRVLVLDDVGQENPNVTSGHKLQVIHETTRARYDAGSPTIITTNLQLNEWDGAYGPATASFLHQGFALVDLNGNDRRRPGAA